MKRHLIAKCLTAFTLFMAVKAIAVQTGDAGKPIRPMGGAIPQILTRSLYEQYTLGQEEDGAQIVYTNQQTQSFDDQQSEISLDFDYPAESTDDNHSVTITQVKVYVESSDGATTQAYVTKGGIGESDISLKIVADNSKLLHYMLVIYGKPLQ